MKRKIYYSRCYDTNKTAILYAFKTKKCPLQHLVPYEKYIFDIDKKLIFVKHELKNKEQSIGGGYRIYWLNLGRRVRFPPTSVLDMTWNNLIVRL